MNFYLFILLEDVGIHEQNEMWFQCSKKRVSCFFSYIFMYLGLVFLSVVKEELLVMSDIIAPECFFSLLL